MLKCALQVFKYLCFISFIIIVICLLDQTGNITVKMEKVTSAQGIGLVQTNRQRSLLPGLCNAIVLQYQYSVSDRAQF